MLTLILISSSLHLTVAAEETSSVIQPRLSNIYTCSVDFAITPSGFASVYFDYYGDPDVFESATAEIYLEKRFLGIFWSRVDIGVTDNVWVDVLYENDGYVDHTIQLEKTGTYRAKFKLTFTGTNTADDVLEEVVQATYE